MNPIVYAIPVFFALMALEYGVARARGQRVYRLGDTINSVGLGALSQISGLYLRVLSFGVYVAAHEALALWQLPADALWVWAFALLFYDFQYYWYHRMGHEVGVLWAAHVVHHQSEDYNLGTALRQTSTGFLLGWIFYLPLAIVGIPPLVFGAVALIDLLYQYWIHTEQVGRLGWFDRVFASPSNHRVHHAVNDRYVDKNYGGILIIWDRIFGTFEDERDDDKVIYGTRKPLRSHDPLWANLEVYAALARMSWKTRNFADKLRVWLKPPGWQPPDLAHSEPHPPFRIEALRKYDPPLVGAGAWYAGALFALLIAAGTHVIALGAGSPLPGVPGAAYAGLVAGTLWALGRWTEGWAPAGALLAALLVTTALLAVAGGAWWLAPGLVLLAIGAPALAPARTPQAQIAGA